MGMGELIADLTVGVSRYALYHRVKAAKLAARREFVRIVSKAVHIKQFADTEQNLARNLKLFFRRQIQSAAKRLGQMKDTILQEKGPEDAARNLAAVIFDPREWDRELIDRSLPSLARGMAEASVSTLLAAGIDVRKRKGVSKGLAAWGHKISGNVLEGSDGAATGPESGADTKASTASRWLEESGQGLPLPEEFDTPSGRTRIGIATEMPEWLKVEVGEGLRTTFSQDYWPGINDATLGDIENVLKVGITDGASIRTMARNLAALVGTGYDTMRATRVARTESGNALNGGRDAGIQGLKEELGEAGQFIGKAWLSVLGNTTRDTHAIADGQLSDVDGNFDLAGYIIPWPSHFSLPSGERCNCQCTITMEMGVGAPEEEIQAIIDEQAGRLREGEQEKPKEVEWNPTMSRKEADKWAEGTVWKKDMFHGTSPEGVQGISSTGFDLERPGASLYGKGVYLTPDKKKAVSFAEEGERSTLTIRTRIKNPLELDFEKMGDEVNVAKVRQYSELMGTGGGGEAGRQALMKAGFDAVRIKNNEFDYVIILDPQNVVVIQ